MWPPRIEPEPQPETMNTNHSPRRIVSTALIAATAGLAAHSARADDEWHRKGTWEVSGAAQYLFGDTVDFSKLGARLRVDDTTLFGLDVGYHLTDHRSEERRV